MSFFEEHNRAIKHQERQSLSLARKLAQCIKKHHLNRRFVNPQMWEPHFYALIGQHSFDTVSKVIDWYVLHIMDEFVPQAHSGKTFREKFTSIVKAMQTSQPASDEVKMSELGQTILTKARERHSWPYGLDSDLPRFIQRSLDNYRAFYSKLVAFLNRHKKEFEASNLGPLRQRYCFLEDLHRNCHYWYPEGTILWWTEWVNNQLAHRKNCNRLDYYIWSLTNEHVRRMDEGHAYEYCGDSKLWSYAIETVMGEK